MSLIRTMMDVLTRRIASLVGGALASRVETMMVLEQVDQQEVLEERALQLERDGKPELAEALRRRALGVDHSDPGGQGQAILSRLCNETQADITPAMLTCEAEASNEEPKPKRRRSTRRRTAQPQNTSEASDEPQA